MFQPELSTVCRSRSEYLARAACSSSSFLASCAFRSAICAWSSAICSCRSFASPSSFLLTLSSSCLLFSSFFSRTEKEGFWSLDCGARSPQSDLKHRQKMVLQCGQTFNYKSLCFWSNVQCLISSHPKEAFLYLSPTLTFFSLHFSLYSFIYKK